MISRRMDVGTNRQIIAYHYITRHITEHGQPKPLSYIHNADVIPIVSRAKNQCAGCNNVRLLVMTHIMSLNLADMLDSSTLLPSKYSSSRNQEISVLISIESFLCQLLHTMLRIIRLLNPFNRDIVLLHFWSLLFLYFI